MGVSEKVRLLAESYTALDEEERREFRRVRVGKFRYALVFRVVGEEIQALAVMHLHRRPGYWKGRARDWPE